jgi:hypothetical protein
MARQCGARCKNRTALVHGEIVGGGGGRKELADLKILCGY